ncbi:YpmA family protein [Halalkalibacter alkaliphilus]|uniref:YpmA family protein n=1 Tax=Halalkalibacter alkaliphilus TaxID=2917993 RepID=A0A9X2CMU8_9BACI|nr:YpmA family protein [Halalkalibacter alkaliphilus]MCL7745948.1 YpmA family protein [Halalkalibacter alkaliphilus]
MRQKMVVLSTTRVKKAQDTYKIVNALNRTLKEQDLLFGLALDDKDNDTMVFSIYRT